MTTTTFDFAPLYRQAVGFDRFANMAKNLVEQQLIERKRTEQKTRIEQQLTALRMSEAKTALQSGHKMVKASADVSYPRYNISQVGELDYQITLALAGFSLDEIDITVTADELLISGNKQPVQQSSTLLHQGINQADFSRKFALAEHVQVVNADMHQGLLTINLNREIPAALQPRKIAIGR